MRIRILLLLAGSFLGLAATLEAVKPINQTFFGGVAIEGYDPVAYFTEGEPRKGRKEFSLDWQGATWRFISAANRDQFRESPERYAPQYGGYCAYAVAQNTTAGIDPEAWAIVDGKLYLNYNREIQAKWKGEREAFIRAADQNWPHLKDD